MNTYEFILANGWHISIQARTYWEAYRVAVEGSPPGPERAGEVVEPEPDWTLTGG
jgi:hypothetical protein